MTLEEEDRTEQRKIPTRSILKNRPGQISAESPVPPNEGTGDNLVKFQNRRVSFANKVKLHQIDFVPVTRDSSESHPADVSVSSDLDDFDESFLKIEQDTDAIVEAIAEHEVTESTSDKDTEETTHSTEKLPQISLPTVSPDVQEANGTANSTTAGISTENTESFEVSNTEEEMELTAPISMPAQITSNETLRVSSDNHSLHSVSTIKGGFDVQATSTQNDERNETHEFPKLHDLSLIREESEDHATEETQLATEQEEVTMDLTGQAQFTHVGQTGQFSTKERTAVASTAEKAGVTKELDQTEELTMDITKPFEGPLSLAEPLPTVAEATELPDSSDFEEDVPMELTQPITSLKSFEAAITEPEKDPATNISTQDSPDTPITLTRPLSTFEGGAENPDFKLLYHSEETGEIKPKELLNDPSLVAVPTPEALKNSGHELSSEEENSKETSPHLSSDENHSVQTPIENGTNTPDIIPPTISDTNEVTPKSLDYETDPVPYQTNTPDMDENGGPLKRKTELSEQRTQKRSHWEAHVVTSTIPLADVSTLSWDGEDDWDDSIPHFSLTEFLKEIGIKFYDDLEFSTDISTRHRLSLSDSKEENTKEDYYRANIQLPLLEVYGLSCKELSGKIQQGKKLFEELQEKTLTDNPRLFKQYYRASYYDQMGMKARFHLLKEYTRQQAKLIWYQWRSKLIENILEVLQNNLEVLQSDKATLLTNISILDEVFEEIQQKFQALRLEVQQFKEIQERFKDLGTDQIKQIKLQLTELNSRLLEHKEKIARKEKDLELVGGQIQARNNEIEMLRAKISTSENRLNNMKHFNTTEIEVLEYKSRLLQAAAGIRFVRNISEHVDEFEFNSELGLKIDFSKPDSPESTTFHLLNLECKLLYNRNLLECCCSDLVEATGFTNVFDSLINLRKKWIKLTEIDRDIYKISLRYPTKITKSENKEIRFQFLYFSFKNNFKAQVTISVPVQTILQYPQAALSSIKVLRHAPGLLNGDFIDDDLKRSLPGSVAASLAGALKR